MPPYTVSELVRKVSKSLSRLTFRTLKQNVLQGRPSYATALENHATRSIGASRHTSGQWSPFRVHCTESLDDNENLNVP